MRQTCLFIRIAITALTGGVEYSYGYGITICNDMPNITTVFSQYSTDGLCGTIRGQSSQQNLECRTALDPLSKATMVGFDCNYGRFSLVEPFYFDAGYGFANIRQNYTTCPCNYPMPCTLGIVDNIPYLHVNSSMCYYEIEAQRAAEAAAKEAEIKRLEREKEAARRQHIKATVAGSIAPFAVALLFYGIYRVAKHVACRQVNANIDTYVQLTGN